MANFESVKQEWKELLGGNMNAAGSQFSEKLKNLTSQVEMIAKMAGSYIEHNLNQIADKEQVDRQIRSLLSGVERFAKEVVRQTVQQPVKLKVKKLANYKSSELPEYQSELASGFDVSAQMEETLEIQPGQRLLVPTGLSFEIPKGYEIQARPRSGWAIRDGISLVNSPGTIDADYRGEVKIILINHGDQTVTIQPQDRIAQLVLCPVVQAEMELSEDLSETERGAGGFGSTGKSGETAAVSTEEEDEGDQILGNV